MATVLSPHNRVFGAISTLISGPTTLNDGVTRFPQRHHSRTNTMWLSTNELVELVHLPSLSVRTESLEWAPTGDEETVSPAVPSVTDPEASQ